MSPPALSWNVRMCDNFNSLVGLIFSDLISVELLFSVFPKISPSRVLVSQVFINVFTQVNRETS